MLQAEAHDPQPISEPKRVEIGFPIDPNRAQRPLVRTIDGCACVKLDKPVEMTMVARSAEAEWRGSLSEGSGTMKLGSGAFEGRYSFKTRFEDGKGTNPEELIAAAHAGCFSMALSLILGQAGFTPRRIHTTAKAHIEKAGDGFKITHIDLDTEAEIPNIDGQKFQAQAEAAKRGCPVSQALAGTDIRLKARLIGP